MTETEQASGNPIPALEPHPEMPPSNIPIPSVPSIGGEKEKRFICEICGREFNSKKDLDLHMKSAHL